MKNILILFAIIFLFSCQSNEKAVNIVFDTNEKRIELAIEKLKEALNSNQVEFSENGLAAIAFSKSCSVVAPPSPGFTTITGSLFSIASFDILVPVIVTSLLSVAGEVDAQADIKITDKKYKGNFFINFSILNNY